jgi:hypothetical protein
MAALHKSASAPEEAAENLRKLSFRTPVYFAGVRNLLRFQQQQIPHSVRDDSFSIYPATCKAVPRWPPYVAAEAATRKAN